MLVNASFFSLYHLVSTLFGILLTFSPMHFLGFSVMPRRIPDFPDSFHSWNFLSSIASGITFISFSFLSFMFLLAVIIFYYFASISLFSLLFLCCSYKDLNSCTNEWTQRRTVIERKLILRNDDTHSPK